MLTTSTIATDAQDAVNFTMGATLATLYDSNLVLMLIAVTIITGVIGLGLTLIRKVFGGLN